MLLGRRQVGLQGHVVAGPHGARAARPAPPPDRRRRPRPCGRRPSGPGGDVGQPAVARHTRAAGAWCCPCSLARWAGRTGRCPAPRRRPPRRSPSARTRRATSQMSGRVRRHRGMAGRRQSAAATPRGAFVALALDLQGDEHPVVAVDLGRTRRLAVDRHEAGALLAGALGEELLEPGAQRGDRRRQEEGHLVAAGAGQLAQGDPDLEGRMLARRHAVATDGGDVRGALEQAPAGRARSGRPARGRSTTAPSSARRCRADSERRRESPGRAPRGAARSPGR